MELCSCCPFCGSRCGLCAVNLWKKVMIYAAVVLYAFLRKSVRRKCRNGVICCCGCCGCGGVCHCGGGCC